MKIMKNCYIQSYIFLSSGSDVIFYSFPFWPSQVERATFKNPPDFLIYPLLVSQLKTMNNPLFVCWHVCLPMHFQWSFDLIICYCFLHTAVTSVISYWWSPVITESRVFFLKVNVLYQDVCVSNVCPDGTLYCQLPSPDSLRLAKILEEINASVVSQVKGFSCWGLLLQKLADPAAALSEQVCYPKCHEWRKLCIQFVEMRKLQIEVV